MAAASGRVSGQIVGEVLAAANELREQGLSPRAFFALLAIGEKADTKDRTASVRWDHVRAALYHGQRDQTTGRLKPASLRSAERAVSDLRAAGLVTIMRRGFKSHGRSAAPVYRIEALPVPANLLAEAPPHAPANEVAEAPQCASAKSEGASAKSEGASAKSGGCFRHAIGGLDVIPMTSTPDVSPDVGRAQARGTRLEPDWEPPREVIEEMRAECPGVDLGAEHRRFVDYWTDKTGANATKLSWVGTWRNWIRKAAETSRPRGSTSDRRVAEVQALKSRRVPALLELEP